MFPSASATSPCGPELSTFNGNSLNAPVDGSTRPILFCICSVNHNAPSIPTAGSWGCAPFVGTSHSLMLTCSSPTVSSGGKFLPRSETGLTRTGAWVPCPARDAITPAAHAATTAATAAIPPIVLQFAFMNSPPALTSSASTWTFREDSLTPKPESGKQGECYPSAPETQTVRRGIWDSNIADLHVYADLKR